ncbi:MAG: UbiA family prenyltransferase [Verrucomicrobiota bacterium]
MFFTPQIRTLVVLGRVANLPTVCSNCLAGWWLGGGGNYWKLPFLLLGVSLLYIGGAFLNDAFDAESDHQRRPERPIPSGKISLQLAWRLGFSHLAAGIFLLLFCSQFSAGTAIILALFIMLYNFSHKFFTAAPWLLGACRLWIYILAGATGATGLNGWPIMGGAVMTLYIAGASFVVRRDHQHGAIPFRPLLLLAAPALLAMAMNAGSFRLRAIWIAAGFLIWAGWCVRKRFLDGTSNAAIITANLMAGIILADWLAVAPQISFWTGFTVFLSLFGLTKWLQKFAPAN